MTDLTHYRISVISSGAISIGSLLCSLILASNGEIDK